MRAGPAERGETEWARGDEAVADAVQAEAAVAGWQSLEKTPSGAGSANPPKEAGSLSDCAFVGGHARFLFAGRGEGGRAGGMHFAGGGEARDVAVHLEFQLDCHACQAGLAMTNPMSSLVGV